MWAVALVAAVPTGMAGPATAEATTAPATTTGQLTRWLAAAQPATTLFLARQEQRTAKDARSGIACAQTLTCSIEEFNALSVAQRIAFIEEFDRLYAAQFQVYSNSTSDRESRL